MMTVEKRASIGGSVGRDAISDHIEIIHRWKRRAVEDGEFQRLDATLRWKDDLGKFVGDIDHTIDAVREDLFEPSSRVFGRDEDMRSYLSDIVVNDRRHEVDVGHGGNH